MKPLFPILMAGALTLTAAAQAQPKRGKAPEDRPVQARMHESKKDRLNLTEEQETKLSKIRLDNQKKQIQLRARVQTARLEMQELWGSVRPDRDAIEKKMREIHDLEYQTKVNRLDHHLGVMGVLTPEQQKLMNESRRARGMRGWNPEMRRHGRRLPGMMRPGMGQGWGALDAPETVYPGLADFGIQLEELDEDFPAPPEE